MQEAKYLMVTNWKHHWDNLGYWNNSTLFTKPMIKDNIAQSELPLQAHTIFIKRDSTRRVEGCWEGVTSNYRQEDYKGKSAIRFDIRDLKRVECPAELLEASEGWHLNPLQTSDGAGSEMTNSFHPPFFQTMSACGHLDFELHCFHLLRLLGIHDLHKIPQKRNAGKADGFFKFQSLSVIYDATLESNFLEVKEQQIENYVNQLKKEKISLSGKSYTIKDTQRQVWIITRGAEVNALLEEDHIKVKEIPYTKLIDLYMERVETDIGSDECWDRMKDLS